MAWTLDVVTISIGAAAIAATKDATKRLCSLESKWIDVVFRQFVVSRPVLRWIAFAGPFTAMWQCSMRTSLTNSALSTDDLTGSRRGSHLFRDSSSVR